MTGNSPTGTFSNARKARSAGASPSRKRCRLRCGALFVLNAQLHGQKIEFDPPVAGPRGFNFEQSFTKQIRKVLAAVAGAERLVTPGHEALKSLAVLDECRRRRTLMPMDWLTEPEQAEARRAQAGAVSGIFA